MKKIFLPTSFICLFTLFFALSSFNARSSKVLSTKDVSVAKKTSISTVEAACNFLYDSLKLEAFGLSKEAVFLAYKGHQYLADHGALENNDVLAICDFSQASDKKRLYIIDIKKYRVLFNTYVAHGKNSGLAYAERFSNSIQSLKSSLGFYVTKETYVGKHGLSLKLVGLENGFNDKAEERAVVMHGAKYIGNGSRSSYMGRSFGCPAVPQQQSKQIINILKNGSCLFIYHPTETYLNTSKILNS